jgi:hypothetical protein
VPKNPDYILFRKLGAGAFAKSGTRTGLDGLKLTQRANPPVTNPDRCNAFPNSLFPAF